jgi:hypothetical protein
MTVPDPADPDLPHSAAALDLGKGWKVRPFIRIKAGETAVLADLDGPASIRHFWITTDLAEWRSLALRFYWDDEKDPSIEVPLGDFFSIGHDNADYSVISMPVTVAPRRGCNCYWPMPFRKHARCTLQNEGPVDANIVAYKLLYTLGDVPREAGYLHSQWRRSVTQRERPEHTIVDGIRGTGAYVGTSLAWCALSRGWWGEGEVKFYIDGDLEYPSIADSGTEDYFGGAWCFYQDRQNRRETAFTSPFLGLPYAQVDGPAGPRRFSLYRWHVMDPIGFKKDLKVTVQALGWFPHRRYEPLTDDIASTAFWYQGEPHAPFPALPRMAERWGR